MKKLKRRRDGIEDPSSPFRQSVLSLYAQDKLDSRAGKVRRERLEITKDGPDLVRHFANMLELNKYTWNLFIESPEAKILSKLEPFRSGDL